MEDRYADDHCISSIGGPQKDGCDRLLIHIDTWIHFHPKGQISTLRKNPKGVLAKYMWDVEDWEGDTQKDNAWTKFRDSIQDAFGGGRFWLRIPGIGGAEKSVWCDVELERKLPRHLSHMCVVAFNEPSPVGDSGSWISSCHVGGVSERATFFGFFSSSSTEVSAGSKTELSEKITPIDFWISEAHMTGKTQTRDWEVYDGPTPGTGNKRTVQLVQPVLLHEFGHYLGLEHHCKSMEGVVVGTDAYCANQSEQQQRDLMAVGGEFRAHHAWPFKKRLEAHMYPGLDRAHLYIADKKGRRPW
jgi:hypothetical protein